MQREYAQRERDGGGGGGGVYYWRGMRGHK